MLVQKTVVAKADAANPLAYVMSDDTTDRMGDVIEPSGWVLSSFKKNPIALFGHSSSFIVGNWRNVRVESGALRGELELLPPVSDRLKEIHTAIEAGVLRAVSVGFQPIDSEPIPNSPKFGVRYTKQELVECSLVAVPANPNALQIAKALNLSHDTMSMIFGKNADEDRVIYRGGATLGQSAGKSSIGKSNRMNLSEKIEQAQASVVTLKDQLTEHIGKIEGEMEETAIVVSEELSTKIAAAQRNVDVLKAAEMQLAVKSEPAEPVPTGNSMQVSGRRPFAAPKKEVKPADYVFRGAVCALLSRLQQRSMDDVRRERYGDDEPTKILTDVVSKTATVPATTTLTGWAAELVSTAIGDFISQLMPQSVYPGLASAGGKFTFGRNGIISLPSRSATPTVAGSFVAQGAPIPVRQAAFTAITLTPKKMGVISTFTREIAEHSTPSIEQIIRESMQEDTAVAIDTILLDATAASTTRPAGLRNGVTVTTATAGGGFAALIGDIKALVGVLSAANSLRSPVWLMNPAQALAVTLTQNAGGDFPFALEVNQNRLMGYPIIQSTTMTSGMVILLDAADFFSATGDEPKFAVTDTATLHMEDTTPLAIGTTGTPNTVAAPVRSLFQTDTIAIRMMLDINWAMRRTGVLAWTQSVTW